ncbi:hypothetical protein EVAR_66559_1 [Eumeta japonica]|uniref:Uncharacterized protein n=1 Tax=Eumeta variegata TaxID=151549 RepID=A0A4C1ZGR5_EUMVA|nr:hypothetical protein EVAR_66559_1 [Eumeta japonica]
MSYWHPHTHPYRPYEPLNGDFNIFGYKEEKLPLFRPQHETLEGKQSKGKRQVRAFDCGVFYIRATKWGIMTAPIVAGALFLLQWHGAFRGIFYLEEYRHATEKIWFSRPGRLAFSNYA